MTSQNTTTNPFEFWKDMSQKWTDAWTQSSGASGPFAPPDMFGSFQSFNPFPSANPYQMWQEILQQYFNTWSDFWAKNLSGSPSPEVFQAAQKQWMEQLEQIAVSMSKSMGTEAFTSMLGKTVEQTLTWQGKFAEAMNPQIDAALRAFNLPSRSQMNRLFDRVIGIEERLDDLEETNREILRKLNTNRRASTTRAKAEA